MSSKFFYSVLTTLIFLPFITHAQQEYSFSVTTYLYNATPTYSSALDLNNDSLDDIIYLAGGFLNVLLNSSSTFNVATPFLTIDDKYKAFRTDNPNDYYYTRNSNAPVDSAVGDVNGDNIKDIVVANYGEPSYVNTGRYGVPGGIAVLLGDGQGGFNLEQSYQFNLVDENPTVIKLNDVDSDGDLDVLTVLRGFAEIVIFINNGNGIYSEFSRINLDNLPLLTSRQIDFVLSDIEKDGDFDVLVTYNKEFRVYLNDGNGIYNHSITYSDYESTYASNVGGGTSPEIIDFDEDGDDDIVVVIGVTDLLRPDLVEGYQNGMLFRQLGYFVNDGVGNFLFNEGKLLLMNTVGSISVDDINFDGHKDIIIPGKNAIDYVSSEVILLLGTGLNLDFTSTSLVSSFNSEGSGYFYYGGTAQLNKDYLIDLYYLENTGKLHIFIQEEISNQSPVINSIIEPHVDENATLNFIVSASDPDNDNITLTATNIPIGATFDILTGEFNWTPTYNDAGTYEMTFTATEDTSEALFDTVTVTIIVSDVNRAPVLNTIGNKTVNENQTLQFVISGDDPDGDTLTYTAVNIPTGSTFDPNTKTFSWTPGYSDEGSYTNIEFTVIDNGTPMELDVELITITVGNLNRAPVLNNPGPQSVLELDNLTFSVSASDPDGDMFTLGVTSLPVGAVFNEITGQFIWTPNLAQAGVYTVTLNAVDNGSPVEIGTTDIVITVGDKPTPVEQVENLIVIITDLDLPTNVENSYMANLQKVEQFILDGKITPALNQLYAFINKIEQDLQQGFLTQEEYGNLLQTVNKLIDDLLN